MSLAKILLGTSRSPLFSLPSSAICLAALTQAPGFVGLGFLPGFGVGGALACVLLIMASPSARHRRILHQGTNYRLLVLLAGTACAWIGQGLVPPGECPTRALMILGGIAPMILGGVSGAQCAFAILADFVRISRSNRRNALLAVVRRRELKRWVRAHGHWIGRASR
jgi:hypothetical protein